MMPYLARCRPLLLCFLVSLVSLVAGCFENASLSTERPPLRNADYFLQSAKASPGDRGLLMKLSALELLLDEQRWADAVQVSEELRNARFSERDLWRYGLARADALIHVGRGVDAQTALTALPQVERQDRIDRMRYALLSAQSLELNKAWLEAVHLRLQTHALLREEALRNVNLDAIWADLKHLSLAQLDFARSQKPDAILAGWLDLASLYSRNAVDPDSLQSALQNWRLQYPQHPGQQRLPPVLVNAQRAEKIQLKQVAVLLPLSGKVAPAGRQLRDGIMAAYHHLQRSDIELKFYDSADTDIVTLYSQALQAGANAVLGPLNKDQVQQLAAIDLPVPTLSFNTADEQARHNFYQFGLPIEDEATQVAIRAARQYKRALIFVNEEPTAERAAQTMSETLRTNGAEVSALYRIGRDDQVDAITAQALGVDASEQRKQALAATLKRELAFQPRRRQDVDVILFALKPSTARRIKPYINTHYGQDLPVLASSYLFTGSNNPVQDIDLEGVEFCDMPWLVDFSAARNEQRARISTAWTEPAAAGTAVGTSGAAANVAANVVQGRLFALGYDAFLILPDLARLHAVPDFRIEGQTGLLSIDNKGRVKRELTWARFHDGRLWNGELQQGAPENESKAQPLTTAPVAAPVVGGEPAAPVPATMPASSGER